MEDENSPRFCPAMEARNLGEGAMLKLKAEGAEPIAIYRVDGQLYATDDICSHGHAFLTDGDLEPGGVIVCPLHGGSFDVRTGLPLDPPCVVAVRSYPVVENADGVYVSLTPRVPDTYLD